MTKIVGSRGKHPSKRLSRVLSIIFYYIKSPCAYILQSSFFHRGLGIFFGQDILEAVSNVSKDQAMLIVLSNLSKLGNLLLL